MTRATLLMTTLLATLSVGAVAQTGGADNSMQPGSQVGAQGTTFTELDSNNDGNLSEDEVEAGNLDKDFDEIDSDGDNKVNRNEYFQSQRQ